MMAVRTKSKIVSDRELSSYSVPVIESRTAVRPQPLVTYRIRRSVSEDRGPLRDRVRAALISAGLSVDQPVVSITGKLSSVERDNLARRIRLDRPLSEIIIEERGER
jgi:hypothetical protein